MDGPLSIEQVFGEVGSGCSHSIIVRAEDGNEYQAKGPTLVKKFRHIGVNELVAAGIAIRMGLPMPPYRILRRTRNLFFATNKMVPSTFHPSIDEVLFNACTNSDSIYGMVEVLTFPRTVRLLKIQRSSDSRSVSG